ncbi:MAG: YHS domain-containing protein [Armatimonadetes bacterium]|nr:YHS domain-containing protein [Armatimonadota bacterium]
MHYKTFFGLALAVGLAILIVGCGSQTGGAQASAEPKAAQSAESPANETGKSAEEIAIYKNDKGEIICPVTGDVIPSVDKASGYQDFQGKRYYFCCGMCPPKFKADPEKFAVRHEIEPM